MYYRITQDSSFTIILFVIDNHCDFYFFFPSSLAENTATAGNAVKSPVDTLSRSFFVVVLIWPPSMGLLYRAQSAKPFREKMHGRLMGPWRTYPLYSRPQRKSPREFMMGFLK